MIQHCRAQKVTIPFPMLKDAFVEAQFAGGFTFVPPTNFAIVGGFLLSLMVEPASIDLAVEIPAQVFGNKDELNYKYFFKRALYLAVLAQNLRTLPLLKEASLSWRPFRGHLTKPILVIESVNPKVTINIHAFAAPGKFKYHRFGPGRNLVRKDALISLHPMAWEQVKTEDLHDKPTPIYNSLILSDLLMVEHLKLLHAECKKTPGLADAVKMAKAWARRRGYECTAFSLSGFQVAMMMAFLSYTGLVESKMSEFHMFKVFLRFVSTHDFGKITSFKRLEEILHFVPEDCRVDYTSDAYQRASAAILIEPVAGLNVLFDWTLESVELFKRDARRTMEVLEGQDDDWEHLFLAYDAPLEKFDAFYEIQDFGLLLDAAANFAHYANEFIPQVSRLKMTAKKLKYALGTRALDVFVQMPLPDSLALFESYPPSMDKIQVGLILDREESARLTELGPFANTEEAKVFRRFWQSRSDLRRFQDGSIREAVAWSDFKDRRHLIVKDVIDFVSITHLQATKALCLDGALDFAWEPNTKFGSVLEAFNTLTKSLKSLEGLPLSVARVESLSSFARMTSSELPRESSRCPSSVIDCLIYFEESSRWPQDYYGVIYARRAFAAQLCQGLRNSLGFPTSATEDYFDVECSKFIFRCYIYVEKEATLMKSQGLPWDVCELRNTHIPRHARKLLALAQANSIFGPACRLFKRWIASLLYSEQISEELAELLVANIFTSPSGPPNSVETAFYRTLHLVCSFPWAKRPLIANLDQEVQTGQSVSADREKWSNNPLCVLARYESEQPLNATWTERCTLSREDLEYLQKLAATAMGLLRKCGKATDLACLFRPSPSRFDIAIHLRPVANMSLRELSHKHLRGKAEDSALILQSLPGFDPHRRMLVDLTKAYNNVLVAYYGDSSLIGLKLLAGTQVDPAVVAHQIESSFKELISSVIVNSASSGTGT